MTTRRKPRKPRIGRPPLSGVGPAKRVEIKLAPADHKRWKEAADRQSQTLSEWLRDAAEKAIATGSTR